MYDCKQINKALKLTKSSEHSEYHNNVYMYLLEIAPGNPILISCKKKNSIIGNNDYLNEYCDLVTTYNHRL